MKDLNNLAKEINEKLERASTYETKCDNMRISAGLLLIEAKEEVQKRKDDGEKITWKKWVSDNIVRSVSDANKCIALAASPDPQKASEKEREKAREGMAKKRAKDKEEGSEIDPTEGLETVQDDQDNKEVDMLEEVAKIHDEIIEDVEEYDSVDALKLRVKYWVENVASFDELQDLVIYMGVPVIPEDQIVGFENGYELEPLDGVLEYSEEHGNVMREVMTY